MKLGALLICLFLSVGGARSQETSTVTSQLRQPRAAAPLNISPVATSAQLNHHYIGVGLSNTANFLTRPVLHPVKTFNQLTFPMRHPLMAFKKFGEIVAPYQSALNGVSALSGPVTAAGVFAIKR